jgi:hypothetical protein
LPDGSAERQREARVRRNGHARAQPWLWWAPATVALSLLAILLRLPFLDAPLTADEGGYAEIARLWAGGERLYGAVWVDRPQGLLLVFRGLLALDLGSSVDLRLVAAGFAAVLVILAIALAARVGGRIPGLICGALVATAGASPFIESFTLSGELIASVAAAAALLAFTQHELAGQTRWLGLAGLCAGSAWMVKQSAFDAALAVAVFLGAGRRGKALATFVATAAVPVVAGIVASDGPQAWTHAVIGYGLHASPALPERLGLFASSLSPAGKALGLTAALAVIGWRSSPRLARIWVVTAAVGVAVGGNFHPHYYLQLVVPLSLVAAHVPVTAGRGVLLATAAAASTVAFAAPLWGASDVAQAHAVWPHDPHLRSDAEIARYVDENTRRVQSVYVLWAAADVYYLADRRPAFRYLWRRNVQTIDGAVAGVRRVLRTRAAALVVVEQKPEVVDPSGATARWLHRYYRLAARVDGVPIYRPRL